jgi:CHAD domain-containing protein
MVAGVVSGIVATIDERTPSALLDEADAVHQLRTAVRRLRNVLAAFSRVLEPEPTDPLRGALAAYGRVLGLSRDLEVRADHCAEAVEAIGVPTLRPVLVTPLLAAQTEAHRQLVAWHRSAARDDLAALLETWATRPAVRAERADRPAADVAEKIVRKQVRRTVRAAERLADADARAQAHALRKAGRRLRHTVDAVTGDGTPDGLTDEVRRWMSEVGVLGHDIQRMLGDERDALLLSDYVRDHAERLAPYDAGAASYNLLVAHAEQAARRAVGGLPATVLALRNAQHA